MEQITTMKARLLHLIVSLIIPLHSTGQYDRLQNANWPLGYLGGVSFKTGVAVPFSSSFFSLEGYAAVSDPAGNILFYTNGEDVWNKYHTLMPSGTAFSGVGTLSTSQGATIVPMPGNPEKYYIFSLGTNTTPPFIPVYRLTYSIIDMSLDYGNGDVDTLTSGIPLFDSIGEKMVTVKGNDCNVWLIVTRTDSPEFIAFNISTTGISTPVISSCGPSAGAHSYTFGCLKASHSRAHLVAQCQSYYGGTDYFDFDANTGIVANRRILWTESDEYGAEFSPDDTRLYTHGIFSTTTGTYSELAQYDLTPTTTTAIAASRTLIRTFPEIGRRDLKLALDGKVYIAKPLTTTSTDTSFIDCITAPNALGVACNYIPNIVVISPGFCLTGLPNVVNIPAQSENRFSTKITSCLKKDEMLTLSAPGGAGLKYTWWDGSNSPTKTIFTSGNYWVYAYDGCNVIIDTFLVTIHESPNVHLGNDTTLIENDSLVLFVPTIGASVIWNNGSTGSTLTVKHPGLYWAEVHSEFCSSRDSINIYSASHVAETKPSIKISTFPNPANQKLTINVSDISGKSIFVKLLDPAGKIVEMELIPIKAGKSTTEIRTDQIPPGVYHIFVSDEAGNQASGHVVVAR